MSMPNCHNSCYGSLQVQHRSCNSCNALNSRNEQTNATIKQTTGSATPNAMLTNYVLLYRAYCKFWIWDYKTHVGKFSEHSVRHCFYLVHFSCVRLDCWEIHVTLKCCHIRQLCTRYVLSRLQRISTFDHFYFLFFLKFRQSLRPNIYSGPW